MPFTDAERLHSATLATMLHSVMPVQEQGYTTPSDWIDIDTIVDGNINLLVSDKTTDPSPTYAFKCSTSTGTYHVDWGDGTSADFASAVKAEHTYTIGTGQFCSLGYTTFKIVISPNTGNLTSFAVTPHSITTWSQVHSILSCVVAARYLTTLENMFYKLTDTDPAICCSQLEQYKTVGVLGLATNASFMFANCKNLKTANISKMVGITNASCMFYNCSHLKSVDYNALIEVTDASYLFNGCSTLEPLKPIDISNFVKVTKAHGMFSGCNNFQSIDVSNMTLVTDASSMFSSCSNLQSANISGMSAITNSSYMFSYCHALNSINMSGLTGVTISGYMFLSCSLLSFIDASEMSAVTNAEGMFTGCESLSYVNVSGMIAITNAESMFSGCCSLHSVNVSGMSAVTNAESMFYDCSTLQSIIATNFSQNAASVTFLSTFENCEQLTNINFPMAKMTVLTARGYKPSYGPVCRNKLATITMHPSSLLNATTTSMDLQYNTLSAAQLNVIFTNLPTVTTKTINITGCTGAATCTRTIATAKGWTVTG